MAFMTTTTTKESPAMTTSTVHPIDCQCDACVAAFARLAVSVGVPRNEIARRCADCGEPGERTGHMECQYPQDRY